ncbi:CTP synthase [Vigna unguiculata]|uniref:CTP synthase (glutamine hydrolyzing) n=1 Tax=Vigna unguiculata TaxID=3917 RepID=A0A4D6MTS7_VIGUN|nr:CTP synthase [Vigna unguiculata]
MISSTRGETQLGKWASETAMPPFAKTFQRSSNFFDDATCYDETWFCNVMSCSGELTSVTSASLYQLQGTIDIPLLFKALLHAIVARNRSRDWVSTGDLEEVTYKEDLEAYKVAWNLLNGVDGLLVLGGFVDRGVQGKILTPKYAREHTVPFLCLGMQIVVIKYARPVLGLHDVH